MLPQGTNIIIHEKHDKRPSWANHGLQGWYISPALEHYCCIRAYIPKTFKERIADTIQVIPHCIPIP